MIKETVGTKTKGGLQAVGVENTKRAPEALLTLRSKVIICVGHFDGTTSI